MSRVRIEVVVAPDGSVTATTHNTRGTDCLPYIQVLEDLLDATTVDSAYTDDWSRTVATSVPDTAVVRDYDR